MGIYLSLLLSGFSRSWLDKILPTYHHPNYLHQQRQTVPPRVQPYRQGYNRTAKGTTVPTAKGTTVPQWLTFQEPTITFSVEFESRYDHQARLAKIGHATDIGLRILLSCKAHNITCIMRLTIKYLPQHQHYKPTQTVALVPNVVTL